MEEQPKDQPASPTNTPEEDVDALEKPDSEAVKQAVTEQDATPKKGGKNKGVSKALAKFNVYLTMFGFIVLVGLIIIAVGYLQSKKSSTTTIKSQTLSQSTLQQLANSDATVGGPQEVLNVESNAVFAGKVLVRGALELAGGLQVSGNSDLASLTVSGQANFQQADVAQSLTIGGNLAAQGSATFSQGIQVNGSGTFGGNVTSPEITTTALQLNGTLTLTHHIQAGGPTPSGTSGSALGSGGTVSVNGSDTAGEVNINIGSGPVSGCFATVTFAQAFSQTPYVQITPVGSAAGGLAYYVTRSTTNFSICVSTPATANTSFGFDYFIVD